MFKSIKAKNVRKRKRVRRGSDSDDDGGAVGSVGGSAVLSAPAGRGTKRAMNSFSTSANGDSSASNRASVLGAIESARDALPTAYAGGATYETSVDTADDRDARAIAERNLELNKSGAVDDAKVYRGQAGYKNYIEKDAAQIAGNKFTGTQGPIRAPKFFRAICRFDYQPDVCKDYKETGFCGYGDSCIFLHDRTDYKTGWQMEKEHEAAERKRMRRAAGEDVSDDEEGASRFLVAAEEEVQFACPLTRKPFRAPVVTQCGHYFEESAALQRYARNPKCAACDKPTFGVFNKATKLLGQLAARERKLRAAGAWPPPEWEGVPAAQRVSYMLMCGECVEDEDGGDGGSDGRGGGGGGGGGSGGRARGQREKAGGAWRSGAGGASAGESAAAASGGPRRSKGGGGTWAPVAAASAPAAAPAPAAALAPAATIAGHKSAEGRVIAGASEGD
eukprot:g2869.t1